MNILEHFPTDRLGTPRSQQELALKFLEQSTKRFSVLELPTGAGKSGVAVASCKGYGHSYIVTPTKSLMAQYSDDFHGDSVQLKGRANYECTYGKPERNRAIIQLIKAGKHFPMPSKFDSCGSAPCIPLRNGKRKAFIEECTNESGPCPYTTMIEECQKHELVIANPYSLIYISYFGGHLSPRNLLVIDEAHDLAKTIRSIATLNITIKRQVAPKEIEHLVSPDNWLAWLKRDEQTKTFDGKEELEKYLAKLEKLEKAGGAYGKKAITKLYHDTQHNSFKVSFLPEHVGGLANELLLNLGQKVVLMSGTIPDYRMFCSELGIPEDAVDFLRVPSDFPVANRPVYLPQTTLDLSHKDWHKNLPAACVEIKRIMDLYPGKRGVIHLSSYKRSRELVAALKSPRVISHEPEDLQLKLNQFLQTKGAVFVSPSIAQGVSLDAERAEWQIIVAPSYPNVDDPIVKSKLETNQWNWYNIQTLIVFLQQCGRVVRSREDVGHTWLLDVRFGNLIRKTWKNIPEWFKEGLR